MRVTIDSCHALVLSQVDLVVLVEVGPPEGDGIEAIARIVEASPDTFPVLARISLHFSRVLPLLLT